MTAVVLGIYAQGKIELLQTPVGIRDGKVRVIVIEEGRVQQPSSQLVYGKYSSGKLSSDVDFAIAEWRGRKEWDGGDGQ